MSDSIAVSIAAIGVWIFVGALCPQLLALVLMERHPCLAIVLRVSGGILMMVGSALMVAVNVLHPRFGFASYILAAVYVVCFVMQILLFHTTYRQRQWKIAMDARLRRLNEEVARQFELGQAGGAGHRSESLLGEALRTKYENARTR
jgi:hypothetical protein